MSYRKLFYASNFLLLAVFAWAFLKDYNAEWKTYQKNYYEMTASALEKQAAAAKDPKKADDLRAEARKVRRSPLEIKQIISNDLGRFDRCITCHVGMDEYSNPTMKTPFDGDAKVSVVYKGHPQVDGKLVKAHPFTKFGCTVCHQGQGLATTKEKAHGWVKNWERPMLKGVHIQGACVKCHGDFEKLKGAEVAAAGWKAIKKHGCQGCHVVNGWGGVISVSLDDIADKPLERIQGYSFKRVKIDGKELDEETSWNIQNWILGHLVDDPAYVTPNDPFAHFNTEPVPPSGMPDFTKEISVADANAITAYLSGLTKEEVIPYRYHIPAPAVKEPAFSDTKEHGRYVFQKAGCAGCHGIDAVEGRRRFNALGKGQPDYDAKLSEADKQKFMELGREPHLRELMGTYTKPELIAKLEAGVAASAAKKWSPDGPAPVVYMPAWKERLTKKELEDLADWLLSVAKKDDSGF
ncbi:MAG: c-type cytochrome [Elusimicrobia bacterium]|nr:c-type cytochrome [Elusimicrobiota bacterium]